MSHGDLVAHEEIGFLGFAPREFGSGDLGEGDLGHCMGIGIFRRFPSS